MRPVPQLAGGRKRLDAKRQFDHKPALVGAHHGRLGIGSLGVRLGELIPRIRLHLLVAQRDAPRPLVDIQDHDVEALSLAHHFVRMAHFLGPGQIGNMNQSVDARLDAHEHAEIGDVAHLARHDRARRIAVRNAIPRIRLELLHAKRNLLPLLVDFENLDIHQLPQRNHLTRVANVLRPAHFRDVDKALDAFLQFHEGAVIRNGNHLAFHGAACEVFVVDGFPRMRLELLQAQRDALPILVVIQHHDRKFLVEFHQLGRMGNAAPGEIGDVQQAVHAAQIDENAEIGDVFGHAFENLAGLHRRKDFFALRAKFLLDKGLVRNNDVVVGRIQLDDLEFHALFEVRIEIAHRTHIDLRTGEEGFHAANVEIDDHAALDAAYDRAFYDIALFMGFLYPLPAAQLIRLGLRQHKLPMIILQALDKDFYFVARRKGIVEFVQGYNAIALETYIYDYVLFSDAYYAPLHDFLFADRRKRGGDHFFEFFPGLRYFLFFLVSLRNFFKGYDRANNFARISYRIRRIVLFPLGNRRRGRRIVARLFLFGGRLGGFRRLRVRRRFGNGLFRRGVLLLFRDKGRRFRIRRLRAIRRRLRVLFHRGRGLFHRGFVAARRQRRGIVGKNFLVL